MDYAGMVVTAHYNNGTDKTDKTIELNDENLSIEIADYDETDGFVSDGTKTIKVSYTEGDVTKTNSDVKVTVNKAEPEEPEVSKIEIDWTKSCCFKKNYGCQDDLDLNNLYIKVHYKDSRKTESIRVTEDMIRHIGIKYHEEKVWFGSIKGAYYEAKFQIQYEGVFLKQLFSVKVRCYDGKVPTKQCSFCEM